ncbi:MAG: hypothetical protein LBT66_09030 [Methanobrevibacter sp.]|jgi:hypothetical protein|nr:hypothetical protein [Candidatus Methanovirga meridionalis]
MIDRIDRKKAIKNSIDYVEDVYGSLNGLNLEEIDISDDERFWLITLGWNRIKKATGISELGSIFPSTERVYKTFYVNSSNGEVEKMKIWNGYNGE